MSSPTLRELAESYLLSRDVTKNYANQVRHRIRTFCEFTGIDSAADVTEETVSAWLADSQQRLSPQTVVGYRANIISVLRYAADRDLRPEPRLRRIRRPKVRHAPPVAWTLDDIRRLYAAADAAGSYWRLYVRVAYDTGLRRGDVLALKSVSTTPFVVMQQKSGTTRVVAVRETTEAIWDEVGSLKWDRGHRWWFRLANAIVEAAGLDGSLKYLRRSHGTYVGSLGHSSESVFRNHYCDPTINATAELPPAIEDKGKDESK